MYRLHQALATLLRSLTAGAIVIALLPLAAAADKSITDPSAPDNDKRYLFKVTLHSQDEIDSMLTRAEMLSKSLTLKPKDSAGIALVLHGPEIEMFTKKNYGKYRKLVDKAARLDSNSVIEIKICRTAMRDMKIRKEDLPAFVEIVPYGPDEEKRLLREGYIYF
jgi:intracellular sulfur oxidation DsrE/DsrF family protein